MGGIASKSDVANVQSGLANTQSGLTNVQAGLEDIQQNYLDKTTAGDTYQLIGNYASAAPTGDQYTLKSYTDATFQPKGNYQVAGNYATQSDLANQATLSSNTYQVKGDYATNTQLAGQKTYGDNTYQVKGDYATRTQLTNVNDAIYSDIVKSGIYDYNNGFTNVPETYLAKTDAANTYQAKGSYQTVGTDGSMNVAGVVNLAKALNVNGQICFTNGTNTSCATKDQLDYLLSLK